MIPPANTSARLFLPALLFAAVAASIGLPDAASAQAISGRVLDDATSAPIVAAGIVLVDAAGADVASVVSDSAGYFRVAAEPGRYRMRVQRIGYTTNTFDEILLRAGEPVIVELRLAVRGIPLEPLIIEARGSEQGRYGFMRRRDLGIGTFLTPDSVELRHPRVLTDAFRAAGALVVGGFGRNATITSMKGHRCMAFFVDNNPRPYAVFMPRDRRFTWSLAPDPAIMALGADMNSAEMLNTLFRPEDILGMEVYSDYDEVPDELRTAGRTMDVYPCGFAIVWTRHGW